ncbi:hypothetical protein DDB_G0286799 [Dictyostelium discoideum AX4]|uniref:Uncharacterized protein n=1 Tax=Dictyostelium discoideum TaxID=44689 RepID=Q54LJ2_DICDI|nr:hypothetical protein DDB_G0286799 [Dictyostelium discoideum AX4]EAL64155.1 hypothetical protein DDB_G0286799 [Dictyostelium discoideum AX4]|eukprot:XP_637569.1 hypothetical protein DDB_G0286799 [Dictyostelium discoideum AX4]
MLFKSLSSSFVSKNEIKSNINTCNLCYSNDSKDTNSVARTITVYKTSTHAFYTRPQINFY